MLRSFLSVLQWGIKRQLPLKDGLDFPDGTVIKNLPANEGNMGSVSGPEDPIGCGVTNPGATTTGLEL